MEENQHQNLHTMTQLMRSQFLKKVTKLVVSVYVFSYLFSQSSFLSFLHSYNFYFSTFPYQLITHTLDKSCMFLLCNGLLVFLTKYSVILSSLSLSNHQDESFRITIDNNPSENSMPQAKEEELILYSEVAVENVAKDIEEEKEIEESSFYTNINSKEEEEESRECVVEDAEEQRRTNGDTLFRERVEVEDNFEVEEEEEEEEEDGKVSTEELNKKFDDFIKKIKQELRIEAQRQSLMV